MLYIANKQFLHKFCINRKKRTLKPSFLRMLATRRIIRAPSIALLTKVLELRSYLGFRAFLFCYTVLAKVFEKIIQDNNKNLRILKKVVEENIHPKNKVLISASQYVNVKNGYKKNIKACIFYQSYNIQLYEKDLFFDDKITTGKMKVPMGIVFIVSKDIKQLQN